MKKRVLALALILVMCLSLLSMTALAADADSLPALQDALAGDGGTVVISGLVEVPSGVTLTVPSGKTLTYGDGGRLNFAAGAKFVLDGTVILGTDADTDAVLRLTEGSMSISPTPFDQNIIWHYLTGNAIAGKDVAAYNGIDYLVVDQGAALTVNYGVSVEAKLEARGTVTYTDADGNPLPEMPTWGNASAWAEAELETANEFGILPNYLRGKNMTRPITRAEFAAVAVKAYEGLSGEAAEIGEDPFTDCEGLEEHVRAEILKAYNMNLMLGVTDTEFAPNTLLNREQAATALTRVFKRVTMPGWTYETDSEFTLEYTAPEPFADDGDISDWAKDSVYFMAANEIILGGSGNNFMPKAATDAEIAQNYGGATREQAIIIALRMIENLG